MAPSSIDSYREHREDAPINLVRDSATWRPVIRLINGWAKKKLDASSGYSTEQLDSFSSLHGVRFPVVLREWWRIAGMHPFVKSGLLPDNAKFIGPEDRNLSANRDFLLLTVDDIQTWSGNGIHTDFISDIDPEIHGINGTITPEDDKTLGWYRDKFIATGLRIPELFLSTLLYHLSSERSHLVRDEVVYLEIERKDLLGGEPDQNLISQLGLTRFPNATIVGDIYSDGEDFIYWWLTGVACRSPEAADRVRQLVPTRQRRG
jgi:hypothetical protein